MKRDLIQFGYNASFEGHPPLSAYAFYYRNQPDFLRTNLTLRMALAPTYLDSELGIRGVLDPYTDFGIGIAGGGFADSYNEIRQGKLLPQESFDGYGGELNMSLYHLFNPGHLIPLNGVLRGIFHYATYGTTSETAPNFKLPDPMGIFNVRSGLRWGGREPTLFPSLAMELSIWYQGEFRSESDSYGFNNDRSVSSHSHLFWGEAYLAYTLPQWHHSFNLSLTAGTSVEADRFSAYRLGGFLPLVAEYPLSLPGYYYQELTAERFALLAGNYTVPLDEHERWHFTVTAATAIVDYLPGFEQPGQWHSGVGAGVFYTSRTWRVMVDYGYGIDAIRSGGRGAHSVGILFQLDLEPAREAYFQAEPPGRWRGFERILGVFGS
ncbi:MAG TPA: hypothetical protein VKY92_27070 [Verrucomicrobiae bacterium]|nr:hypothetical protein [Verrucomicrobiae bacterium]